ncbi:MAG: tRNA-uridine aminocarboxypropyltransferase [Deltaproteobacteria bacterium]
MSRRENAHARCPRCRMHASLCICDLIPRIETRTRLLLVIHRIEDRKPTNTGRLAVECLPNSEVSVRGFAAESEPRLVIDPGSQPVFLFPADDAIPIARFVDSPRPVTLIVPDGTWRQAFKVRNRVPGMRDVPCVTVPPDAPTRYRLRAEPHKDGLATIEAIARALGVLEGSHVREKIERVFDVMVGRTRWSRGELPGEDVPGGVPDGALKHDPLSGRALTRSG